MISWKELIKYNKQYNTAAAWKKQSDFIDSTLIEFVRRLKLTEEIIPGFIHNSEVIRIYKELKKELEAK